MVKHDTLLICSSVWEHRQNLRELFRETFHLLEASGIAQLLLLMQQNSSCIAAILLDITDIGPEETEILRQAKHNGIMEDRIPIIVLAENDTSHVLHQAFGYGASDVIPVNYDSYAMRKRVQNIIDLHVHKQYLEDIVEEQKALLRHTSDSVVDALSSIIEHRSVESGQHILRIRHFTKILLEEVARCCPEYQLTEQTIALICSASALHDIGKIAIPDAILMKPGALTREEREIMNTHADTGCQILNTLVDMADQEYLRYAYNICRYHHERWDGSGYPEGLRGEAIPICAQVVGLADAYDALTSKRVYKDAYSVSRAVNMIIRGECGAFSPKLLECFKNVNQAMANLAQDYADGASPRSERFELDLSEPEERQTDSIEWLQGKYYALAHYINGFLIDVDFDRQLFHLIYNPYPELASIRDMETLEEIQEVVLRQLIHPSDRERMTWFLEEELSRFLDQGLRRMHYPFRLNSVTEPQGEPIELTLLRINPLDAQRRTLTVLVRKIQPDALPKKIAYNGLPVHSESAYCCRNDQHFTLLDVGNQDSCLAGYSFGEIRAHFGGHLLELAHPEDRDLIRREFTRQLREGTVVNLEHRVIYRDGTVHWVYNTGCMRMDENGQENLWGFLIDINRIHYGSTAMQEKLQRYEIILAQTENVLFEWDAESDTVSLSDTWEKIFGVPPIRSNLRQSIREGTLFHPDDVPTFIDRLNALERGSGYEMQELRVAADNGRYLWCRFRATAIRDPRGSLKKICGIIINIDAEKQAVQALQSRAEQDSLTRLLNKDAARKQAEEYFERYPDGIDSALMIIDLDNFKQINDQYGHLFGDAVLTQAAREIRKLFRGQDIIARIGGDEFMVVMRGISDRELLEQRCGMLLENFRDTFRNQQHMASLGCSIGVALAPRHGRSYFELFRHADQALYAAKAKGKNCYEIYDPEDGRYPENTGGSRRENKPIDSDTELGMANDSIVRYAVQKLYTSLDMEQSVHEILELVGQQMNASRVYVFENSEDNRFCSNTYEWCNQGIPLERDGLQNVSYETDIPGYWENFDENGIFYCPDITLLPKHLYEILAPQGIKSMLQCAIRENGVFRGYIGFDECREQRLWTRDQIELLTFLSESLSMFLLQQRRRQKVQQQADELRSILDNQDAWIYIVDPEDFRLNYVNGRLREYLPEIRPGMVCHQVLKNRQTPCEYCPILGLGKERNRSCLKYNPDFGCHVLLEAARIQWEGSKACLMTSKKLPGMEMA